MAAKVIVAIMVMIPVVNGGLFQRAVAWRSAYCGRGKRQCGPQKQTAMARVSFPGSSVNANLRVRSRGSRRVRACSYLFSLRRCRCEDSGRDIERLPRRKRGGRWRDSPCRHPTPGYPSPGENKRAARRAAHRKHVMFGAASNGPRFSRPPCTAPHLARCSHKLPQSSAPLPARPAPDLPPRRARELPAPSARLHHRLVAPVLPCPARAGPARVAPGLPPACAADVQFDGAVPERLLRTVLLALVRADPVQLPPVAPRFAQRRLALLARCHPAWLAQRRPVYMGRGLPGRMRRCLGTDRAGLVAGLKARDPAGPMRTDTARQISDADDEEGEPADAKETAASR